LVFEDTESRFYNQNFGVSLSGLYSYEDSLSEVGLTKL